MLPLPAISQHTSGPAYVPTPLRYGPTGAPFPNQGIPPSPCPQPAYHMYLAAFLSILFQSTPNTSQKIMRGTQVALQRGNFFTGRVFCITQEFHHCLCLDVVLSHRPPADELKPQLFCSVLSVLYYFPTRISRLFYLFGPFNT